MEVIIFAIVAFIISAITKRKKADEGARTAKPVMSRPRDQQQSTTKIEDYAKQVYEDMQKQVTGRESRTQSTPVKKTQMKPVQSTLLSPKEQLKKEEKQRPSRRSGRLSTHHSVHSVRKKSTNPSSLVPTTKNDMLQAIVFSEILSPPKSKR
ncbi:MAG: hypothetical protein IMZ40_01920 [Bacilli bacterium]|nr:hypothetical protein [Bacilli bacterium]